MAEAATTHAQKYLPNDEREGIGLCLSGGGYRAALFHLGALRRLNELGILSQVKTITSVSGGSIIAAHLATAVPSWPRPGESIDRWDELVATPFKAFTQRNIRTGPLLRRLLPQNWFVASSAVEALAAEYEQHLTGLYLDELPTRPNFVFCATDLSYACNWKFERAAVGDHQAGYMRPPPRWRVARAVAASSCFPPVFNPLPVGLQPDQLHDGKAHQGKERDGIVRALSLSDGGVYDNMGLEPVWKNHATVLVSDGGPTFAATPDSGFLWQLQQYVLILDEQAGAVRKRWLIANFLNRELNGTYWGIGSSAHHYNPDAAGYPKSLVDSVVSRVRIDLDAMSPAEAAVLENHGYTLADAALTEHAKELLPAHPCLATIPNGELMDREEVETALRGSDLVLPLGRC